MIGLYVPDIKNKKRLTAILIAFALFFLAIMIRLAYIVLAQGQELQEKAQSQWTRDLSVSAKRGSILDRNLNELAKSASVDTVVVSIQKVVDADRVAELLSGVLEMEKADISSSIKKAVSGNKSEIWLKRQITAEQSSQIIKLKEQLKQQANGLSSTERKEFEQLNCINLTLDTKRYYPNKDFLTQVLGYTTVDGVGQEGIEKKYDKYLRGQQGRLVAETDRDGQDIPFANEMLIPPSDGYDVVLTIDEVLQSFLEKAVTSAYADSGAKAAWGIAVDPSNGQILALVNVPDFDLNSPPRDDLEVLQELSRNKVIVDIYEPGSTFKIITTAAALDSGAATMDTHYTCTGSKVVDGETIKCWRSYNPHGDQVLEQAVMNSCNPAFMTMALAMGKETFYDYIYKFGFGQYTDVDYSADSAGMVRDQKYIRNTDLARIGFGQSIAVTPLQLVMAASAAVNGGVLYRPYMVTELRDPEGNVVEKFEPEAVRQVISAQTSEKMAGILEKVVAEGSGKNAAIPGYRIGGKTGTAQKYENGKMAQGKVVASFLGFAPTDKPRILTLIAVDEPNASVDFGSVIAAPYVKMFYEDALKYMGIEPELPAETEEEKVIVPDIVNMTTEDAKQALTNAGLPKYLVDGTGIVVNQMPAAGLSVSKDTTVLVYTQYKDEEAQKSGLIQVPDLKGKSVLDAADTLKLSGLKIEIEGSGLATDQSPAAGEEVLPGETVKVYFEPPIDE